MLYEVAEPNMREQAVLVGLATPQCGRVAVEENLTELARLADTAGADTVGQIVQSRPNPDAAFYVGQGKIHEIRDILKQKNGNVVIFDDDLSSSQIRNIQNILHVKVIDRTNLILDIFARHARTGESKIQVELAQLQYLYPRLTRAWSHFGQQTGRVGARGAVGIGTRGPGETQLESDRRQVQKKIADLRRRLRKVEQTHHEQSKRRQGMNQVCLVGYTNAGKSTLMNSLAKSRVKVENQLFSTLDTTTRRIYLNGSGTTLVSDTVGFIRKLPTHLVESFRSTLYVAREASLLLHVVDTSSLDYAQHMDIVQDTLRQIKAEHVPQLMVFNKIDLCPGPGVLSRISRSFPEAYLVSAVTGLGVPVLRQAMVDFFIGEKVLRAY